MSTTTQRCHKQVVTDKWSECAGHSSAEDILRQHAVVVWTFRQKWLSCVYHSLTLINGIDKKTGASIFSDNICSFLWSYYYCFQKRWWCSTSRDKFLAQPIPPHNRNPPTCHSIQEHWYNAYKSCTALKCYGPQGAALSVLDCEHKFLCWDCSFAVAAVLQ